MKLSSQESFNGNDSVNDIKCSNVISFIAGKDSCSTSEVQVLMEFLNWYQGCKGLRLLAAKQWHSFCILCANDITVLGSIPAFHHVQSSQLHWFSSKMRSDISETFSDAKEAVLERWNEKQTVQVPDYIEYITACTVEPLISAIIDIADTKVQVSCFDDLLCSTYGAWITSLVRFSIKLTPDKAMQLMNDFRVFEENIRDQNLPSHLQSALATSFVFDYLRAGFEVLVAPESLINEIIGEPEKGRPVGKGYGLPNNKIAPFTEQSKATGSMSDVGSIRYANEPESKVTVRTGSNTKSLRDEIRRRELPALSAWVLLRSRPRRGFCCCMGHG